MYIFNQMLKPAFYKILLLFFAVSILSACGKLRQKRDSIFSETKKSVNDARRKIAEKKEQLSDKIFPGYDGMPDTESNKKRFKEHLQVALTEDVKNIRAFGDFIGVDYKVLMAFTCDSSTIRKIISVKKMQLSVKGDPGLGFLDEFDWWDKEKMKLLVPYKKGTEAEYWEYLWYDPKTRQAYYEEYSM
jgi:hypothetical protein